MTAAPLRAPLAGAFAALALAAALRADPPAPALTLAQAEATALRLHPQVVIARLRGQVAEEEVRQSRSALLPALDAYGDGVLAGNRNTRILAGGINNPSVYDRVADGLGVSELITDFGQTQNRLAGAKLAARAASENAEAVDQQILLAVDVNFFRALQAQAVLGVARATLAARDVLVEQVTALAKNQLKSELDVSFAEVAREQARLLLQQAQADADGADADLAAAMGERDLRPYRLVEAPAFAAPPSDVELLIDAAWNGRPDLLGLRYRRDAALRLARASRDQNYPTIAAVGEIGNTVSHDYRLPDKYAVGGITVDVPLFAGGYYQALQREAELQAQIAGQAVRDEEDTVSRDVRLAWLDVNTSVERLRTTEELLRHADQAYDLAQARYRIGSSSIVELNDAQVNATSAQIAEANARYDELIQQAILRYQTGTLR